MTPLPAALGGEGLVAWRIDLERFAGSWDSGEGAYQVGGRWNSRGVRAVYCSLDPACAILEVAVHRGFRALDMVPHVLTALRVKALDRVHLLPSQDVPESQWLSPGIPTPEQQAFGDALLGQHEFVVAPSVVSRHSWNVVFSPETARGRYEVISQEPFVLDPRLHAAR